MSKYEKKADNNITLHSAFLGCFGLELNYLHLRLITEFFQERGDSLKWLPHAAGGGWSRCAWCQTALCVLSCYLISLYKRALSARVVLWRLALSPQTEPRPCRCYLHPPIKTVFFFFFVSQTATLKSPCVIFIWQAPQSVKRMPLNGSDSHPRRER